MRRRPFTEAFESLSLFGLVLLVGAAGVQGCSSETYKDVLRPSQTATAGAAVTSTSTEAPPAGASAQQVCRDDYPVGLQECREKGQASNLSVPGKQLAAGISREREKARVESEKRVVKEALAAVQETQSALESIEDQNKDEALTSIKQATGDLEIVLARDPELSNVPLDFGIETINLAPDRAEAARIGAAAQRAVNEGRFQEARALLDMLTSEIRVTTTSLPLATYPDAMKEAARLLAADDLSGAEDALRGALATLVVDHEVYPIPLINTMTLIGHASGLAEGLSLEARGKAPAKGDVEKLRKQVLAALADARGQLELAETLGYGSADIEYEPLDHMIDRLERQVTSGEGGGGVFAKLVDATRRFYEKVKG